MTAATATPFSRVQFETQLESFVSGLQAKFRAFYAEKYPDMPWRDNTIVTVERGQKVVRVVKGEAPSHNRSVHCFVEIATGKVIKPAGWKAPAKRKGGEWQSKFDIATDESLAEVLAAADPYGGYLYVR